MPHARLSADGAITRAARCFNIPLRLIPRTAGTTDRLSEKFFSLGHPAIDLVALKRAEDGNGFVLRLCNMEDVPVETSLTTSFAPVSCFSTNLVETGRLPLTYHPSQGITLAFGPFEVRTVLFALRD